MAKTKLFTGLSSGSSAVINSDDAYGQKLVSMTPAKVVSYGIKNNADVMAKDIQFSIFDTKFKLITPDGEIIIRTKLVGSYNVYNILAAAGACLAEGIRLGEIKGGIETCCCVPGRLEKVDCGQDFTILIDYAHTQDALENVLTTLKKVSDAKIILVFGCGGNRDQTKRPLMGHVASQLADYCFITNDNPRNEDPQDIVDQIMQGFDGTHCEVILNREEAIGRALKMAQPGDVVLIAGKGHETYQVFKEGTIKFDEKQIVRQFLLC